ncbi:hypothetical protein QYE76_034513 [Lolium multiflorum]|uniref:Uncharacterized protein n=1 Tax=Lolium multiflorum TaxID=4521 RepID=A0AAD8QYT9_LOLMU|nr:hypothetical protein QYE76_034513 [Lolium multiflorum]
MVDTPDFITGQIEYHLRRADHPFQGRPRALVLEAQIGGYNMSKVFMDGGSGLNLLFASTMKAMGLTVDMLKESDTGFHSIIPTQPAYSLGKTSLDVVFGTPNNFRKEKVEFEVVDWESQYHAILGRPAFAKFMAVPHYAYLKLKMPGNNGTPITVHGSFARSDNCDREFQKIASKFGAKEELNAIDTEGALIEFLRERWEIFAWEPSDMPGIPRELAEHALNVDPTAKPVQQSMRRFSEPKRRAIGEEINRLRKAGFIRELKESEWVANPVMVPKKDTTALRMCIDYTSLNKHCPKDHFSLPRIDQIVDSTTGCDRLLTWALPFGNPSIAGIPPRIDEFKRTIVTQSVGWCDRIDVLTRTLDSPLGVLHVGRVDDPTSSELTSYYCSNCDTRHGLGSSDTPFICNAPSGEDISTARPGNHPKTAHHQVYVANNTGNTRRRGDEEHTPRSSRRASFENSASNRDSDYTIADEEWAAARAAVLNNTPLPAGTSVGTLNAYRSILEKNREHLSKEQASLERRLSAADRSSERRRGSQGSASRNTQGAGKHRSRMSRLSEDDA